MKIILLVITLILSGLLSACSDKHNAFEPFAFTKAKELSEDTILTLKIKNKESVHGIVSVIYLNKVFPKEFHTKEYFYVYYYLKEKDEKISFLLNNKKPLSIKELNAENRFSTLTNFDAAWSKYYLLVFNREGNILDFQIKTDKAASATLKFVKDK